MKRKLEDVTLLGIDCVDIGRLLKAAEICESGFEFASVKLLTSIASEDERTVQIRPIRSKEEYSRFVIAELDKYVDTSHVLIFQHDGFILTPSAWSDEFLEYDYIGAPWLVDDWCVRDFGFPRELLGKLVVGNGGFSLRSKRLISACAKLAAEKRFSRHHPEDNAICIFGREILEDRGMRFAPPELAKRFSFEYEDDESKAWNGQFGFHGFYTDISKWIERHPEYRGIVKKY